MIKVIATIEIEAHKPEDEEMKKIYMENAEKIIQKGLEMMTVPDWTVTVTDIKE